MGEYSKISIRMVDTVDQVDAEEWNGLSSSRPFQSHDWYKYGEQVMEDCRPIYLLAYQGGKLEGRLSLWLIRNEPLPQYVGHWKIFLRVMLRKWPLLICRSPLSFVTGIVIREDTLAYQEILDLLIREARLQAFKLKCSALIFDYLGAADGDRLPKDFYVTRVPNPGTSMHNTWNDFDDYLASGNKKDRQHYKRTLREAQKLGMRVDVVDHMENIDVIVSLIRVVERQHGAPENPWIRRMIEKMEQVHGSLLLATMDDRLVGCGLLVRDGDSIMATALGRVPGIPYVYLLMVYEGIKFSLNNGIKRLRWGSGAYDVKQSVGFELEDNGVFAFFPIHPVVQKLAGWLA